MSPFPVNPRWYEEYWMTEQPPRLARLAVMWWTAPAPGD